MAYSFIFVDDEDIICENIQYMADYNALGYDFVGSFRSVSSAVSFLEKNHVDLVLTDIVVGSESGLDLAEICSNQFPDTLVILISAHRNFEFAQRALDCQVFSYLVKPTSCEDLTAALSKAKIELDKIKSISPLSSYLYAEVNYHSSISMALQYINEHFTEDISRNDLAVQLNITPQYFSKYFKKYTGKSFVYYLNEVRINYAMKLLHNPALKINEISSMCNYISLHYFLTLFKQFTSLTPTEYRKNIESKEDDKLEYPS